MKNILPSKQFRKVFGAIILGILLIIGIGILVNRKTTFEQKKSSNTSAQVLVVGDLIEKDSDGDGLKDWEESLWGTDPNKKDTDGNGKTDFEEIRAKQDELSKQNQNDDGQKTYTESVSKEIVALVATLQSQNQLGKENQDAISNQFVDFLKNRPQQKTYTLQDIQTTDSNARNVQNYKTLLFNILDKTEYTVEEIAYLKNFELQFEENDPTNYIKIKNKTEKIIQNMLEIKVPTSYALKQVSLLNSFEKLKEVSENLSLYEKDPLISLISSTEAAPALDLIVKSYSDIINQ